MALKIVTGGTTGAADGTLVSSGNPLVIVALNTAVDAHIRCDDGYWSSDQSFDVPAQLEVSFDGGTVWYDNADEPITAPEIYAVNVPIKIRQTVAAGSTSGSFTTDGTYTAITALSTPTLTVTPGDTQNALSWTNVANEDASPGYTVEWSANGSTGWTALTTTAQNVTTYTDTGLTNGVARYYRVKAEGSGRYSDSGWGTGNGTPVAASFTEYGFAAQSETITTDGTDLWVWSAAQKISKITTAGTKTDYTSGISAGGDSYGACLGPDGRLWFTDYTNNKVYAITTGGTISAYTTGFAGKGPCGICSDGTDLFVACLTTNQILKVTAATGAVASTFSAGTGSGPFQICWNSGDSMLWFTQNTTHEIAKISNTGTGLTEYATTGSSQPYGIVPGPDGNLWFAQRGTNKVCKITTSGTVTEYAGPTSGDPCYICSDGGYLWVTDFGGKGLLKVSTSGTVTDITFPTTRTPNDKPLFIIAGPDNRVWMTAPTAGAYGYAYGPV